MALPFILLAAKAGTLLHAARPVLTEWKKLDPAARKHVAKEAGDVRRSMMELGRAVGARVRSRDDEALSWEEARKLAMSPAPEFLLAQQVVARLRADGELTEEQLGGMVQGGAELAAALAIAEADGFIERAGDARWRITAFADHALVESTEAVVVEEAVVEHLRVIGLAGREELALGAGAASSTDADFLAGLERAFAKGAVEWLAPELFGLPRDQLAAIQPPADTVAADSGQVKTLLGQLSRELNELRVAVAKARAGELPVATTAVPQPQPQPQPQTQPQPQPGAPEPTAWEALETLKRMREADLITDAEFEQKKADVLRRL